MQSVVLELGAVFALHCQYLCIMLALRLIGKGNGSLLDLTPPTKEIYPSYLENHHPQTTLFASKTIIS
jgi:hypothetical protein